MSSHVFDRAAWSQLDIFNQMGNIGSEVGRAMTAKRTANLPRMESAFARGMDLFNATVDDWAEKRLPALPELLIAREQFAQSILTNQEDATLEDYFMNFATAARNQR